MATADTSEQGVAAEGGWTAARTGRSRELAFVLGCMLLALALGSHGLADKGVGLDEAASAGFALHGPSTWLADHNMALYYAALGGWLRAFGAGERALRSLSVVCFVASLPPLAAVARGAFSPAAARSLTLLYACNPVLVRFAQEARGYMLELLLLIVSTWALRAELERPRWGLALVHGTTLGLAVYAHLFAAWLGLVHGVYVVWLWRKPGTPRLQLTAAMLLSAAIAAPACVAAADGGGAQIAWLYPPSLRGVWASLTLFAGGAVLACLELPLIAAFAASARASQARPLFLIWLGLPLLGSWLFSLVLQPIAHPKYLTIVVPAWLAAVSGGLEWIAARSAWLSRLLLVCLLLASSVRLHGWYVDFQKERWREVVSLIAARAQAGDGIVLDVMGPEAFDYYVAAQLRGAPSQVWPRALFPQRAWRFPSADERFPPAPELAAELRACARVWLVRNRSQRATDELPLLRTHRVVWQVMLEPHDEDADSLFADSHGRIISLQLYAAQ